MTQIAILEKVIEDQEHQSTTDKRDNVAIELHENEDDYLESVERPFKV